MDAVVHYDRPAAMPSQSQMAYSRSPGILRGNQGQPGEICYKSSGGGGGSGSSRAHNSGGTVGVGGAVSSGPQYTIPQVVPNPNPSYPLAQMRYLHASPYPPPPPPAYRDNSYSAVRTPNIVNERVQNVDFMREPVCNQSKPRISLLPPTEYLASLSRNRLHQNDGYRETSMPSQPGPPPPVDLNTPVKKIRLGEPKSDLQRTLRIDTRQEEGQPAVYNPQVEAISPTLPTDAATMQEDANFRSTKDDLLHGLAKVDREITKTELQISKLKRKQQELEEVAKKPALPQEEEEVPQPKHHSPAQKIYAENRRKAHEAHSLLKNLGPKIDLPLYNQPSDTAVYHENKRRHMSFKKRLLNHLMKKQSEREQREKNLTASYSELVKEWLRKVDKIENSSKRKLKEAKNREFFEKIFPKLRKQREDRERFNRVGARVKSDADLEEIMDGLQEQEMEDKKMRSYAVVPPLLLDAKQRSVYYVNNNGRLDDFAADYKERQLLNVWTQAEKDIFKEKFLQHPKNFTIIASYLDRKSVSDCVQYYYLSKKTENYKRLLRKSRQRTRSGRGPQGKVGGNNSASSSNAAAASNSVDSILAQTAGVTTRLQREQLSKQEPPPPPPPPVAPVTTSVSNTLSTSNTEANRNEQNTETQSNFQNEQNQQTQQQQQSQQQQQQAAVTTTAATTAAVSSPAGAPSSPASTAVPSTQVQLTPSHFTNDVSASEKPSEERKDEKREKDDIETTDDDNFDTVGSGDGENVVGVACAVCKSESTCSRALPRSQASQYGLREDEVGADARVCNLCRCKAVRSRFTNCPISTCPNARGHRVKRLRQLPSKWNDLPSHIRDPIAVEFQIDKNVTKCCSACYNRITRRISVVGDTETITSTTTSAVTTETPPVSTSIISGRPISNNAHSPLSTPESPWSDEEVGFLRKALKVHGTRWSDIAQMIATGKTPHQCMNFYYTYNKKFGLDQIIQKIKQREFQDRKPVLTDEEESGSTTSSCDENETGGVAGADSDTTSAPSPSQHNSGTLLQNEEQRVLPGMTPPPKLTEEGRDILDSQDHSPVCKAPTPSMPPLLHAKEDYDSSATETADEGQGGGDVEREPGITHGNLAAAASSPGPVTKREDRTVKDLMLEVIEMQLKKDPGPGGVSNIGTTSVAPTISSILKSEHGVFRDRDSKSRQDSNLATVSVVSSHHSHQTHQEFSSAKDGLVVVQVGQGSREPEPVTLDLSIKKPREAGGSSQVSKTSLPPHHSSQPSHNSFRSSQPSSEQQFFHQQVLPPPLTSKLSPGVISSANCAPPVSKSVQQSGSIIHGTPVSSPGGIYSQARYEQATLHHSSPHKETGSITQGTPVHQRNTLYGNSEYYGKRSSAHHPSTAFYPPTRPPAYSVEQRQIIMNDYITSQQMHGGSGSSGSQRPSGRSSSGSNSGTAEKVYSAYSGARQGVIQRHTVQRPPSPATGVSGYPPGHEAFSSLVDVAVRQPSLPVPPPQVSIQEDKRRISEGLGDRFSRESTHERYVNREPEARFMKEPKSLPQIPHTRADHQAQQSLFQLRDQMHVPRESYSHHLESHQTQMQQMRERDSVAQQQQKLRDHHLQQMQHHQAAAQQAAAHQAAAQQAAAHQAAAHQAAAQQAAAHQAAAQQAAAHQAAAQQAAAQQAAAQQAAAAAAAQQRQISSFPPRLIHESHHGLDQRLITVAGFRDQVPLQQQSHTIRHSTQEQCGDNVGRGGVRGGNESSTLTAASLIDAIITHQINQSSESQGGNVQSGSTSNTPQAQTRPGDRLFQGFHRECSESNGKLSPIKMNMNIDGKVSHSQSGGPPVIPQDHVEMYNSRGIYQGYDQGQTWKLRRALQTKEDYGNLAESPVPLSPLDYVKNRIAEVMRTSEEDSGNASGVGGSKSGDNESSPGSHHPSDHSEPTVLPSQTFLSPPTHYTYPYSALSLGAAGPAPQPTTVNLPPPITKSVESIPEPAPLLSAQYEPLSDED